MGIETLALRDAGHRRRESGVSPRPYQDGLIAATALVHGMTLVTRNVADFEPMGVALLNLWKPPA